jgi:2-oxoglutarate ferredoxin oxidoreductase subunit delta
VAASTTAKAEILINRDWCKGCNICVALCPTQVLALDEQERATVIALERCTLCRSCELHCPDLAIEVRRAGAATGGAAGAAEDAGGE